MIVTILATIVTAPFSLANFQQFSTYAVIANAIVVPVVDFWIMPLAIVVYFFAPLGWRQFRYMAWNLACALC